MDPHQNLAVQLADRLTAVGDADLTSPAFTAAKSDLLAWTISNSEPILAALRARAGENR